MIALHMCSFVFGMFCTLVFLYALAAEICTVGEHARQLRTMLFWFYLFLVPRVWGVVD